MEKIFRNQIKQDPFLEGPIETDERIREELRSKVEKHYQANNVPENLIEQFIIHNDQVEYFVDRFSREEKFNEKETEIALLSAILHDIAKGYGDFLNHGKEGGKIAKEILIDMGISEKLAESVRLGIERHMGREGYPTDMAKKKYGDDFEYPKYATKVGKMIFECDILTQLTKDGFNKILLLRETDKENRKEDEVIAKEKNITREDAAVFSVIKSVKKSYNLIKIESIKEYAGELWQKIQEDYEGYFGDGKLAE
ncbi:MAG: HD domain-containing protein [Candidatus Pacebacteria bacterium]|nr:HD domain-containing protein [Candidatus Paceibacterota bacterium]